jgi:hypothetical protein
MIDLNDTEQQRDFGKLIPDGTFVKLKGKLKRGGATIQGMDPMDAQLFKLGKEPSDAMMLDWDFVVLHGTYAKQHLFQLMVVDGGTRDEKGASKAGNITKQTLRSMVDSATGLMASDKSPDAQAKRQVRGFSDFDGIEFAARIGIEAGSAKGDGTYYSDKNKIGYVVVPGDAEWQPVMSGQEVEAKPSGASTPRAAGGGTKAQEQKPAWQREAAPAAAGAAPAWQGNQAGQGTLAPAGTETAPSGGAVAGTAAPAAGGPAWLAAAGPSA